MIILQFKKLLFLILKLLLLKLDKFKHFILTWYLPRFFLTLGNLFGLLVFKLIKNWSLVLLNFEYFFNRGSAKLRCLRVVLNRLYYKCGSIGRTCEWLTIEVGITVPCICIVVNHCSSRGWVPIFVNWRLTTLISLLSVRLEVVAIACRKSLISLYYYLVVL